MTFNIFPSFEIYFSIWFISVVEFSIFLKWGLFVRWWLYRKRTNWKKVFISFSTWISFFKMIHFRVHSFLFEAIYMAQAPCRHKWPQHWLVNQNRPNRPAVRLLSAIANFTVAPGVYAPTTVTSQKNYTPSHREFPENDGIIKFRELILTPCIFRITQIHRSKSFSIRWVLNKVKLTKMLFFTFDLAR